MTTALYILLGAAIWLLVLVEGLALCRAAADGDRVELTHDDEADVSNYVPNRRPA